MGEASTILPPKAAMSPSSPLRTAMQPYVCYPDKAIHKYETYRPNRTQRNSLKRSFLSGGGLDWAWHALSYPNLGKSGPQEDNDTR